MSTPHAPSGATATPPQRFLAIVKIRIDKPFAHWKGFFDAHAATRAALGIEDVLCAPVIGEQAVVYAVRTAQPRLILDMMYEDAAQAHIRASGHLIGQETFTLCESLDA
jgi:hypothetical protein